MFDTCARNVAWGELRSALLHAAVVGCREGSWGQGILLHLRPFYTGITLRALHGPFA